MQCLSDILQTSLLTEEVRSEAAGVIAQITTLSLTGRLFIHSFLEHMVDIVQSLTGIF